MSQAKEAPLVITRITTVTQKPRANVEPFVRSIHPVYKTHSPTHDPPKLPTPTRYDDPPKLPTPTRYDDPPRLPTPTHDPLRISPTTTSPSNQKHFHRSTFTQPEALIRTPRDHLHTFGGVTEIVDTNPGINHRPYPTTSTPIGGGHGNPINMSEHSPTRLFPSIHDNSSEYCCSNCTRLEQKAQFLTESNRELKRLLVASLGEHLKLQMEQLINEKAAISCDLNISLRQLSDNIELVDKVSIDCDVWRSKYLASRLMIDELASVKREVSHHLVSSQQALVCMLGERDQLSQVLTECNTQLRRMTTTPAPSPSSGTVLDMAVSANQMVQSLSCISVGGSHVITNTTPQAAPQLSVGGLNTTPQAATQLSVGGLNATPQAAPQLSVGRLNTTPQAAPQLSVGRLNATPQAATQRSVGGLNATPQAATQPTMGEKLAKKVLMSRGDRQVQLPLRLREEELSRHSLRPHPLLCVGPDLHCRGCKGPLIHV